MSKAKDHASVAQVAQRIEAMSQELKNWLPYSLQLHTDEVCIYCVEAANNRDHIIPISFFKTRRSNTDVLRGMTIDACTECNSAILGSRIFFHFVHRLDAARAGLLKRYKKFYIMPEWDFEELDQLSGDLRNHVYAEQMARSVIVDRLNWQFTKRFALLLGDVQRQAADAYPDNFELLRFFGMDAWQEAAA